jgi:hypothetical protein
MARAFYNTGKWGIAAMTGNQNRFESLSANMIAFVGAVLYNAIKEYQDDGKRKTIPFHGHLIEGRLQRYSTTMTDIVQITTTLSVKSGRS